MADPVRVNIETWASNEVERLRAEVERLRAEVDAATYNEAEVRKHLGCRIEAADRANAEVERLRERAECAERERDALAEACLTRYSNDRWGVTVGNYAVGTFDSRDAAIREMLEFAGLDTTPAGEESPP
jgi:hypothetical protein